MLRTITLLITLIISTNAIACSCHLGSVEDKLKDSESVFLGKVSSVKFSGEKNDFGEDRITIIFEVEQSFKNAFTLVSLETYNNEVSCEGYRFKEGEKYLVYAYKIKDKLSTFYCGGVVPKNTQKDSVFLKELNQLKQLQSNTHNKPLKNGRLTATL